MVDERELIRRARLKDHQAFEQLVVLKRDRVFRIAFDIVGDEDEAKDVAQSAFIKLWSSLGGFDENSRFDPWFYRIVVNLAIDVYRRRQRRPRLVVPLEGGETDEARTRAPGGVAAPGADAELMRAELRRIFNELAVELAPAQRAVFTLREIEGVATEDIARIMGIKVSTVRNHLLQARRLLQDRLRHRYPEYSRGPRK